MNSFSQWLNMGGYGTYVWGSYGCTVIVFLANLYWSTRRRKALIRQTQRWLEKASQ